MFIFLVGARFSRVAGGSSPFTVPVRSLELVYRLLSLRDLLCAPSCRLRSETAAFSLQSFFCARVLFSSFISAFINCSTPPPSFTLWASSSRYGRFFFSHLAACSPLTPLFFWLAPRFCSFDWRGLRSLFFQILFVIRARTFVRSGLRPRVSPVIQLTGTSCAATVTLGRRVFPFLLFVALPHVFQATVELGLLFSPTARRRSGFVLGFDMRLSARAVSSPFWRFLSALPGVGTDIRTVSVD